MDGFRDRMGRGSSDRYDRYDESRYDRAERGSRRSSYGASPVGLSAEEVNQIIDDSNAKQLDVISDFFEDAKDDLFETEKQLMNAIDSLQDKLNAEEKEESAAVISSDAEETNETQEAILREVRENSDLLAQFAEEQLPMLVRGNSSMLSQINESLEEKGDLLREILNATNNQSSQFSMPVMPATDSNSEEVLQTVINNNTLLNSLRAEVAGIQGELRDVTAKQQMPEDDNGPLDVVPVTKEEMNALYGEMEEHVHKECVKVYKNVQAALETQNATVAETVKAGGGGTKILLAFNLVLLILNLAVTIAHVLDFI
ncbi:MAG: hypothetical protein Q4E51_02880 [Lachnospiraceae bacterium]|nr:hypothetical protein [Lachnospiraceae bacterium]